MASLYDSASLVMIPSGYKDDKLYSIKPTDGSGDFTFSRDGAGASPATRVNASGLIEKGRENVILQSNTFDTTWFAGGTISVTGGQSGYDGSNDAWLLDKTQANAHWRQDFTFDGSVVSYSLYVKKGSLDWVNLNYGGTNSFFDLTNGLTGITTAIDSTIEDVGNGWYRCSAVNNYNGVSSVRIYPADGDNDTSGTSGNIYIQDAQLEAGLVATDYIETTTAPVSAGLLGDMPRLDYSGGATCGSLLLEPSRVNSVTSSEYFGGSDWSKTNSAVTDNDSTSPEGVQNATSVNPTNTSPSIQVYIQKSSLSAGTYTFSVFAKYVNSQYIVLRMNGTGGAIKAFDIQNGTKGSPTYSNTNDTDIEDYGNGWYRCSMTCTMTSGWAALVYFTTDGNANYTPSLTDETLIYGAQVESGSYPTSYIPTYGSASTRGADDCNNTSASAIIGQTEGTLYVEVDFEDNDSDGMFMTISDGTSANRLHIGYNYTSDWIYCNVKAANLQQALLTSVSPTDGLKKIAVAYKQNDFVMYINGTQVAADTNANVPTTNRIDIGGYFSAGFEHPVKQNLLFKTRLTNAELAALTA